jgi:hypothetical protein
MWTKLNATLEKESAQHDERMAPVKARLAEIHVEMQVAIAKRDRETALALCEEILALRVELADS